MPSEEHVTGAYIGVHAQWAEAVVVDFVGDVSPSDIPGTIPALTAKAALSKQTSLAVLATELATIVDRPGSQPADPE